MEELYIQKLITTPPRFEILRTLEIILLNKDGKFPEELLSDIDIKLINVSDGNIPFIGV